MKCRSLARLVLPAVSLLLLAHSPTASAAPPTIAPTTNGTDVQGGQETPRSTFDVRANTADLKGGQVAPKEYVDKQQDLKAGRPAPRESVDPLRNRTDVIEGVETPRETLNPLRNNTDVIEGQEAPRQYDLNGHLPARRNPNPKPVPSPAPRATPNPPAPPAYLPPPIRPQPLGQAAPRRPQAGSNLIWNGPRYANAYGTWSPPRVTANYGPRTESPSRNDAGLPSTADAYAAPSSSYGSPKPTYSVIYDDNAPKSPASTYLPAKGVLMRLGIDPSTYKSDYVADSLLDQIRLGS